MSLTVEIKDGEVLSLLTRIAKAGADGRIVAAEAAARCARNHFRGLQKDRHRPAAGMMNFYGRAVKGTSSRIEGDNVIVSIDSLGLALRRYGGTVRAKRFDYLTLVFLGDDGKKTFRKVKETHHDPDPSVLPSAEDFEKAIIPRLLKKLDRI
jgi:hypothetical protein